MNKLNKHECKNLSSKTVGLLALYASILINQNKKILKLCKEEIAFFEHAEKSPGYAHLHSDILFNAFYNLSTADLKKKFEGKLEELTEEYKL